MPIPWLLIFVITFVFFVWERLFPGRELPESPQWYLRAAFLNSCQIAIVTLSGLSWSLWLHGTSLFHFSQLHLPILEGFVGWFVGTFFEAEDFAPKCGFPQDHEKNLGDMLLFRDSY